MFIITSQLEVALMSWGHAKKIWTNFNHPKNGTLPGENQVTVAYGQNIHKIILLYMIVQLYLFN
jgi:hypothetical protein